ncbi:hypothetical protein J6590_038940 [Homalodisca vitripennis]|nr:hypothetical protein J6590_038940 [Homalodisca vitripennis]
MTRRDQWLWFSTLRFACTTYWIASMAEWRKPCCCGNKLPAGTRSSRHGLLCGHIFSVSTINKRLGLDEIPQNLRYLSSFNELLSRRFKFQHRGRGRELTSGFTCLGSALIIWLNGDVSDSILKGIDHPTKVRWIDLVRLSEQVLSEVLRARRIRQPLRRATHRQTVNANRFLYCSSACPDASWLIFRLLGRGFLPGLPPDDFVAGSRCPSLLVLPPSYFYLPQTRQDSKLSA